MGGVGGEAVTRRLLKFLAMIGATVVAFVAAMAAVEVWVRLSWDEKRGLPGFYLSDPVLGQRLAPNYEGWFAGVPVRINALGFRDTRDYALEKSSNTFRILVLGDSVTFGHGALSETTYPFLLEQNLKKWRPDIDWQVWNLGVPGYNTSTELNYLGRVGSQYRPDLVIVGFYENDLADNALASAPSLTRRTLSAVQRVMQRNLYSYELYKRVALTVHWRLVTQSADRGRIDALAADEALLTRPSDMSALPAQQLTPVDRFDDGMTYRCPKIDTDPNRDRLSVHLASDSGEMRAWRAAVAGFQRLHREGAYRIAFFINMAPNVCPDADRFFDGGALEDDAALRDILDDGTPAGSSVREFLAYRPTQMPGASGHSFGNSNRVKADALFRFLRDEGLLALER
jgi:GDSL-like Lipase/Acylhydrolase family